MDRLQPGKINWNDKTFQTPKIEAMRIMRERERIAMFSKYVQEYGVPDTATFPTESLHEKGALNLAQVCVCIRALGIEVSNDSLMFCPAVGIYVRFQSRSSNWLGVRIDLELFTLQIWVYMCFY